MDRKKLEEEIGLALKFLLKGVRRVGFSGRLWGTRKRKKENLFYGSHADFGKDDIFVSVFVRGGKIEIAEYVRTKNTTLGKRIRQILEQRELPLHE